jgi:TPR repeat protein
VSTHPDCARARPLAEQACRIGTQAGCVIRDGCSLENASQVGPALERLRAACAPRAPLACLYWADQSARSPAADSGQIIRAYRVACQPGRDDHTSMVACARLAMAELGAAQSKIQAEAAIAQLKRECERSSREACCDLGEQYRSGKWVPVDAEKAQDLRTRACNLGCDRCCR